VIQSTPHSPLGHNLACCLIPLTWLVTQICVLLHGYHSKNLHVLWQGVLLSNEALHYAAFSAVSLFAFFIAYEAVLVPLQILIAY
jgi:NADH:ubiquinone oxidoreductase subunit 4 (subunit M)